MNKFYSKLSGTILSWLKKYRITGRITFIISGIAATVWFLIRVIPKPSRATYPCMRAAAPVMSGFVIYLLSFGGTVAALRKARKLLTKARYVPAISLILVAAAFMTFYLVKTSGLAHAANVILDQHPDGVNAPMGTPVGIKPGRVVWAWNKDATNENCTNKGKSNADNSEADDYYFQRKNNDQAVIDDMVDSCILRIAGIDEETAAWDSIFCYFNNSRGKGRVGYTAGEKIFIKINMTDVWTGEGSGACPFGQYWGKIHPDFSRINNQADIVETTPFSVLAVVKQLVDKAGVPEDMIYIGDPMKEVYKDMADLITDEYQGVHILYNDYYLSGLDETAKAKRVALVKGTTDMITFADPALGTNYFYTIIEDASYMINIAALKAHACAGITLCAKNHFGSHTGPNSSHLHPGLLGLTNDEIDNGGYHKYRVQVDLMAHNKLGRNTLLFIVDGLYSGQEAYTDANSVKWRMEPFNDDYPSSIFMSQDDVALESVCFDFLWTEYDGTGGRTNRPHYDGVDDYLHQAADPSNRPEDITYAPDGTVPGSLGVHEHWNNPVDKMYTKNFYDASNMSKNIGIDLVSVPYNLVQHLNINDGTTNAFSKDALSVYPNPASDRLSFKYTLDSEASVRIEILDLNGRLIACVSDQHRDAGEITESWDLSLSDRNIPNGMYLSRVIIKNDRGVSMLSRKINIFR